MVERALQVLGFERAVGVEVGASTSRRALPARVRHSLYYVNLRYFWYLFCQLTTLTPILLLLLLLPSCSPHVHFRRIASGQMHQVSPEEPHVTWRWGQASRGGKRERERERQRGEKETTGYEPLEIDVGAGGWGNQYATGTPAPLVGMSSGSISPRALRPRRRSRPSPRGNTKQHRVMFS